MAIYLEKGHDHLKDLYCIYKTFIECKAETFNISSVMETLDVGFFSQDELPELSAPRNTSGQLSFSYWHL